METPTFTCATCDAADVSRPVFHLGLAFCCAGCAADGPCMCSYDTLEGVAEAPRADAVAVAGAPGTVPVPVAAVASAEIPGDVPSIPDLGSALAGVEERVLVAAEA